MHNPFRSRRPSRPVRATGIVAALALVLSACTGTGPSPAASAAASDAATSAPASAATSAAPSVEAGSIKLGIAYWDTRTYAFQLMLKGAEAVAAANPAIDLTSAAPDAGDPAKLLPLFQAMAQTQKGGIVLQTLAADPFFRPVKETTDAGTPVIAIDAPPPADAGVGLWITNDNKGLGKMLAQEILKQVPADSTGEIVIGTNGPSVPPLVMRVEGMIEEITAQRPGVTVVGPLSTMGATGTPSENYTAWDGIIKTNPDALAYLAPGAQDAVSLALYQQRNGVKLLVGGMDLEPPAIQAVQDGYVAALVSPEHWLKGYIATRLLADYAENGTPIPTGLWDNGGLVVNSSNIDDIATREADDASIAAALAPVGDEQIANQSTHIVPWP